MTASIFVVILRYLASEEKVDEYRAAHVEHLREFYANGKLLISGKQKPGFGGIIIARGKNRDEVEQIMRLDPFCANKVAEYQIFEFTPARSVKELEFLWS